MKRVYLLLTAAIITGSTIAQDLDQNRNEISIYVGGGISSLQYKFDAGKHKIGFGGQAGIGYSYFFTPHWSILTGVEVALYHAKSNLSNFSDSYNVIFANEADNYTYKYKLDSYKETQQALYLNIPLMAQYQTGGKHKFYMALGGKVGFPLMANAKTVDYDVKTEGYFPAEGRTYDDLPQHGFGTYNYDGKKNNLEKFRINFMASAEMGIKLKAGVKNAVYTGIYADYVFSNINKNNDNVFVQSSLTGNNPQMSPVVESQYGGKSFANKITALAVGLKVRIAFGCGKNFQKEGQGEVVKSPVAENKANSKNTATDEEKARVEKEKARIEEEKSRVEREIEASRQAFLEKLKADKEAEDARQAAEDKANAEKANAEKSSQTVPKQPAVETPKPKPTSSDEGRANAIRMIEEPITDYTLVQTVPGLIQQKMLDERIALLKQYPDIEIFIYGHTCDQGNDNINEIIALVRAQNGRDYLISKGISAKRIKGTVSKRDTEPYLPNTSDANRFKNRRIQFKVLNP